MRGVLLWLGFALVKLGAASLPPADALEVVTQALAYRTAAAHGDADRFLALTHPSLHTLFGGKEPFEAATRLALKTLVGKNSLPTECKFTAPRSVFPLGAEELCFVPFIQTAAAGEVRTRTTSYYLAVRTVGASTWKFLDAAGLRKHPELLAQLFPGLPKDAVPPPNKVEILK